MVELFTSDFKTHSQMATLLLNNVRMMAWSGIAHSVNNGEYCIQLYWQCQFRKADRMPNSINLFQADNCFCFKPRVLVESHNKMHYFITTVSRDITR